MFSSGYKNCCCVLTPTACLYLVYVSTPYHSRPAAPYTPERHTYFKPTHGYESEVQHYNCHWSVNNLIVWKCVWTREWSESEVVIHCAQTTNQTNCFWLDLIKAVFWERGAAVQSSTQTEGARDLQQPALSLLAVDQCGAPQAGYHDQDGEHRLNTRQHYGDSHHQQINCGMKRQEN